MAHLLLSEANFANLVLSLSFSLPLSLLLLFGEDWVAQKETSKGMPIDFGQLVASLFWGSLFVTISIFLLYRFVQDFVYTLLLVSVCRAAYSYCLAVNIQRTPNSFRTRAGLFFFEPLIVWSLIIAQLEMASTESVSNFNIEFWPVSLVLPITAVYIACFLPIRSRRREIIGAVQKTGRADRISYVCGRLINSVVYLLPVGIFSAAGMPNSAAYYAVAQRYANIILVFEQARSRIFSARLLAEHGLRDSRALFIEHKRSVISTGLILFSIVAPIVLIGEEIGILTELKVSYFFLALLFSTLTLLEFGMGGALQLKNSHIFYFISNSLVLGASGLVLFLFQDIGISFLAILICKLLYNLSLYSKFKNRFLS